MKKVIKKALSTLIIGCIVLFTLGSVNSINASTTSVLNIRYNIYKLDDFKLKVDFETIYGYDYATAVEEVDSYNEYLSDDGQEAADKFWSSRSCTLGFYPGSATKDPGKGHTYQYVKDSVDAYNSVTTTTTFSPGDKIAVEPLVEMKDGTKGKILSVGIMVNHKTFASNDTITPSESFYIRKDLNANAYSSQNTDGYGTVGFTFNETTNAISGEVAAGAIYYTIDTTAKGNYDIGILTNTSIASHKNTTFVDQDRTTVAYSTGTTSRFNETKSSITVQGASSNTKFNSLKVNGSTINTSSSSTTNVSGSNYDTFVSTEVSDSNFDIEAVVAELGKISSVTYGKTANDAINSPAGSATSGGGKFTVPTSWPNGPSTGDTIYVAVTVIASDGVTEQTYIIEVPKAKSNQASLDDISFNSNSPTTTTVKLKTTGGVDTTFSSSVTSYKLYVAGDTTQIGVTPMFDTQVSQTCLVNTLSGTSGSITNITAVSNNSQIVVKMIAQDGVTTKSYTFTIVHMSTDTTISGIAFKGINGISITPTYDPLTKTYTINGMAYSNQSFVITPTIFPGQKISINGTDITNNTPTNIDFTGSGYGSSSNTVNIVVTSEAGTTETYKFIVNRDAASSDTSVSKIEVIYGSKTEVATTLDGINYTIPSVPYTTTSFTVRVTLTNGTIQTVTINGFSSNPSASIIFPTTVIDTSKVVSIIVTAQNTDTKEYTLNVPRTAAEADTSLDEVSIVDNNNVEIGVWNSITGQYTITENLLYKVTGIKVTAIANGQYATVTINGGTSPQTFSFSSYNQETLTVTIVVTSQSNAKNTLTILVTRDGANNDETFSITANSDIDQANGSTSIPMTTGSTITSNVTSLIYETQSIAFTITPNASTTKILIGGIDYTGKLYTYTFTNSVDSISAQIIITIVTEANSTGKNHTLKFTRDKADDNYALKILELKDVHNNVYNASTTGTQYSYVIPQAQAGNTYYLNIETVSSKAHIYVSTNANDFKQTVYSSTASHNIGTDLYVTIYSQYGSKITYVIKTEFTDTRDSNSQINNISIVDYENKLTFTQGVYKYQVNLPFSVTQISFDVVLDSMKANLKQGVTTANLIEGSNLFKFQAQAENGTLGSIYEIEVIRSSGSIDDYIESLKINGIDTSVVNPNNNQTAFNKFNNTFDFVLPRNVTQATLVFVVSTNATFQINHGGTTTTTGTSYRVTLVAGGYVEILFSVKSEKNSLENGTANIYTIRIYCADQDYAVSDIQILDDTESANITNIDGSIFKFVNNVTSPSAFTVKYSITNAFLKVISSNNSVVTGDGLKNLAVGSKTYTIKCISEYASLNSNITNQSVTYQITIVRNQADTVNTLDNLSFIINGVEYITTFNKTGTTPYIVENIPESVTKGTVSYTLSSPYSTVRGDTGQVNLDLQNKNSQTLRIYVKSESGVEREYQIIVSRETISLDNNNEITGITASDGGTGYLTFSSVQDTYNITIPGSVAGLTFVVSKATTLSTLSFNGSDKKGIISYQEYITINPGESLTITVKCIAQDGSEGKTYTINISKADLDKDATLSDLKVNGTTIDGFSSGITNYTINEKNSTLTVYLSGTPTKSTSKITSNSAPFGNNYTLNIGSNILTITVTAEDTSITKTYTVTIIRDADNSLSDLEVIDDGKDLITFNGDLSYSITVPYSTANITINALAIGGNLVSLTGIGNKQLSEGLNVLEVEVKTASGVIKTYTINITREKGVIDAYIETYFKEDLDELVLSKTIFNYTYVLSRQYDVFNAVYTISNKSTSKIISPTALKYGKNEIKIQVTSETGVVNTYTFVIYRAENELGIDDINALVSANGSDLTDINDPSIFVDYTSSKYSYNLNVSYKTDKFYLDIITIGQYATIVVNGVNFNSNSKLQNLNIGSNRFEIYVISEYGSYNPLDANGKSATYTINITREAANSDATLKELHVYVGGEDKIVNFDKDSFNYTIEDIGNSVSSVNINAIANSIKSIISGNTGSQKLEALNVENVTGYIFNFLIIVTAENGNSNTYTITISRGPLALDEDNTINFIELIDSSGIKHISQANFNQATSTYEVVIPYGVQSYTITADKLAVSPSTVAGVGQFTINPTDYGTEKIHYVYATSQKGVKGTTYIIVVQIEAPSTISTLSWLKADGVSVPDFSSDKTVYTLSMRSNFIETIIITALQTDSKSIITGVGTFNLAVGINTFTVRVTAQDKSYTEYKIIVSRDYPNPYLTNLNLVGEFLLDTKDKKTTFDSEIFEYHAIVTYMTVSGTILVEVDNLTHIVSCSNATFLSANGKIRTFSIPSIPEGKTTITIDVTSAEGKSVTYTLIIQRRGPASTNTNIASVEITEIPKFKADYSNLNSIYNYEVENKIRDLNILVTLEKNSDINGDGASYKVFNDKNLNTGIVNQVIILITAEDGITTKAIIVNVTRKSMNFTVNTEATDFLCEKIEESEHKYNIYLQNKNALAIKDYTKYINFASEDNLEVTIISDVTKEDCKEVILLVSDGSEERKITFNLITNQPSKVNNFSIYVWILLGLSTIILTTILITVNKNKYGNIVKHRKKLK